MDHRRKLAHAQFESWSRWYDRSILQLIFFGPTHRQILKNAVDWPKGPRILDIGCGTGIFAHRVLTAIPDSQVTGLDLCDGMISKAKLRCQTFGSRGQFQTGDSEHLPFPSASFDVVCCSHSFHHYPNQAKVVAEMARVLRSDGHLIIADGNRDCLWGRLLYDGLINWLEGGVHHCSRGRIQQLFESAGLSAVTHHGHGWVMPFLVNRAKRLRSQTKAA